METASKTTSQMNGKAPTIGTGRCHHHTKTERTNSMDRKQQDHLVNKYCMNCEVGLYNCKIHLLDCTKVQEGEKKKRHRCQWKDVDCPKDGVSLERNCMECEHFPDNEGKENFNNEPRQVIQVADFYGSFPACPACHEPAYDDTRCHFCGQPYTWPEPDPEDRPTIKGGHYAENGEVVCDACGCADLQFVYHADGKDRYGNGYNCAKCGAAVQMIFKRR